MQPVSELLASGVELMLLGMGVVFLLLGLLVVTVTYMSRVIQRMQPHHPTPAAAPPVRPQAGEDQELIAAIGIAIHRYRNSRPHSH